MRAGLCADGRLDLSLLFLFVSVGNGFGFLCFLSSYVVLLPMHDAFIVLC